MLTIKLNEMGKRKHQLAASESNDPTTQFPVSLEDTPLILHGFARSTFW